jgi:tetratricopeptide (TPR) repeat protein
MAAGLCFAAVALTRRWIFSKSNFYLGLQALKQKQYPVAVYYYSQSLKLKERPIAEILLARSKAFLGLKDHKRAIQDCEEAFKVEHQSYKAQLHFQLVRVYDFKGDRERANAHYDQALHSLAEQRRYSTSSHIEILMFRAGVAFDQEDYINAQIWCLEIEALCKDRPEHARHHCLALCLKAYAYLAQGENNQAMDCKNAAERILNCKEVSQLWQDITKGSRVRPAFLDEMSKV